MQINDRLTVDHLRTAVTLSETASFTEAARRLQISQSSLSRRVAELEQVLGVAVFSRTTRRVELTSVGHEVLESIRIALMSFDRCVDSLHQIVSGDVGSITIGCLPSIAATILPGLIRDFVAQNSHIRVEVRDGLTARVLAQVKNGSVDIGISATTHRDETVRYEKICEDTFYCALPSWHELADCQSIEWKSLSGERWITFSPFTSISQPVERSLEAAGVRLEPSMVGHNVGAVAGLIASGLGITAVPGLVKPLMDFAQLSFVPLSPTVHRDICVLTRKSEDYSPSTKKFIELVRLRNFMQNNY